MPHNLPIQSGSVDDPALQNASSLRLVGKLHNVHPAIATAIHAISTTARDPESIWCDPYPAEVVNVMLAVEEYICHGDYPLEPDGRFYWNGLELELDRQKIVEALKLTRFCTDSEWPEWMRTYESAELGQHQITLRRGPSELLSFSAPSLASLKIGVSLGGTRTCSASFGC
jgi:hypothetical protein